MATPSPIPEALFDHLRGHVDFIVRATDAYDDGHEGEIKRLAVSLSVLFHDTAQSRSLMEQVDGLKGQLLSTTIPHEAGNLGPPGGLIKIALSTGASSGTSKSEPIYYAPLDEAWTARWLSFPEWWNERVYIDDQRTEFTRRGLVLAVASKDSEGRIDATLSDLYARLSRHETLGWNEKSVGQSSSNAERAALRQIAHETLKTLFPPYRKRPKFAAEMAAGGPPPFTGGATEITQPRGYRRNEPCPCGSGKRVKSCHGAM